MQIDSWLLDILACPECHAPLRVDEEASELVCTSATCGLAYPVRDDIPVLLVGEARRPGAAAGWPGSAPRDPRCTGSSSRPAPRSSRSSRLACHVRCCGLWPSRSW